jgi:hypothetical protein
MAIVNFLQRHLKAISRVLLESSLDIKEIGSNEDAEQPELIYKKSDSSGYLHIPTIEWLQSYISGKSGSKIVGVYEDNFSKLEGNVDLQNVIKQIDTLFATPYEEDDYVFTCNEPSLDDLTFTFHKNGNLVYCKLPFTITEALTNNTFIRFDPPSGGAWQAKYAPTSIFAFYTEVVETVSGNYYWLSVQVRPTYIIMRRVGSDFISAGEILSWARGAPFISYVLG